MKTDQPDGGPAFPSPAVWSKGIEQAAREDGMSLRDWFAGQALAGYLALHAGPGEGMPSREQAAERAYEYADAMLTERKKKG